MVEMSELAPEETAGGTTEWLDNETAALGAAWYPVALSSEVADEPFSVQLLGQYWVLARLEGELVAFVDTCPHRLLPLSAASICDGRLRCAYHGWEFDASGMAVRIPSLESARPIKGKAHLKAPAGLEERYGLIWLAPLEPVAGLPTFPEWDDPAFECRIDNAVQITAGCGQVMDNSCDTSHFAFVHAGTFGGEATELSYPRSVTRDGWRIIAVYESTYRVLDDPRTQRGELPELQRSIQTKIFHLGSTLELRMHFPDLGSTFTILACAQPEREGSTRLYRVFARNDIVGDEARWAACLKVEQAVQDEDISALSRYRDHRLPLNLREEVHVPADKLSLAYRRLLIDLVRHSAEAGIGDGVAGVPAVSAVS
jgi:phenylpropionate dioxygenase-like ring-hydroxylating dioxygenase large terminal subunit